MTPARLQLSRAKGFDLQAASQALNGLSAVNVARPSKWGNPFRVLNEEGHPLIDGPHGTTTAIKDFETATRFVVKLFRERCVDSLPHLGHLKGKNLACWCTLDHPCHADVLLEIANR